jgi:subtilisin family serine protease
MKKKVLALRLIIGLLPVLLVVSVSSAQIPSKTQVLDENQQVITRQQFNVGNATPIGKSGFYKTTIREVRNRGIENQIELFPSLNYVTQVTPNDPREPQEYLTLLNAGTLWEKTTGDGMQVVAVIDSGFALNHEDLAGRWAINEGEYGSTDEEGPPPNCTSRSIALDMSCNNIDDDANGYVDDWRGWDFAQGDNDPLAGTTQPMAGAASHGTRVAGLIGITGNNGIGAASLNWQVKILPLQIFTDGGSATTIELAEAISYAIEQQADIINLSLGTTSIDSVIEALLSDASSKGIVVVAAAGNCGGDNYQANGCSSEGQMLYPATSPYTISVAATDLDDNQAIFSSRGLSLDIAAPGSGNIISSNFTLGNRVSSYTSQIFGTSFSAPIVSGLIAHLRSGWPESTPGDLRSVLVDSALKLPAMNGSFSTENFGFGRVKPDGAYALATKCKDTVRNADINCDGSVNLLDLSSLASQWQLNRTGRSDINKSGKVDLLDLSALASQWGQ